MHTVPCRNGLLIYLSESLSKDHSMSSRFRIHCYPFYTTSAAAVGSFLYLHHLNVLLSAVNQTMSALPTVEILSQKTPALAFAFQSMKIGLIIAKCLPCLIVIVMLSEARFHWFDTIWVALWALLVISQSQTNLIRWCTFLRHCNERWSAERSNGNQW